MLDNCSYSKLYIYIFSMFYTISPFSQVNWITSDFVWSIWENKLHLPMLWEPLICIETQYKNNIFKTKDTNTQKTAWR